MKTPHKILSKRKISAKETETAGNSSALPITTERAIFLQGEINETLAQSLTPQILRLKEESSRPITVFIDSPGGSPVHASRILGLLRAIDQNGESPDIYTVATGDACSAAADFLTQGDYIMAHRHALLWFHGTRTTQEEITRERAEKLEAWLESDDKEAARRLARGVFERFLMLQIGYADQISTARKISRHLFREYDDLIGKSVIDIPALVFVLCDKTDGDASHLLKNALDEMRRIKSILDIYNEFVKNKADSAIFGLVASKVRGERKIERMQLRVLESVIASSLIEGDDWDLRGKSFKALEADFTQVVMLAEGFSQDELLDLILQYKEIFFSDNERIEFEKINTTMKTMEELDGNKAAKKRWDTAIDHAYNKAEPLWRYVSTLCRLLNEGENEIDPEDAWHMGLIDEVVGLPLAHRKRQKREIDKIMSSLPIADTKRFV